MISRNKKSLFYGALVLILVSVFFFGIYFGYNNRPEVDKITALLNKERPLALSELNFSSFWKVWNLVESKYVNNGELDRQEMIWGAMSGLVKSLDDPYSIFMPPEEAEVFESNVKGEFGGVGMEIGMRKNILTVIAPLKNTPAEKAGIKAGDQIIKVDDNMVIDITIDEAVKLIRGEIGTKVILTVLRKEEDDPLEIEITRGLIEIPVLDTEKKEEGIFVIKLYTFSANSGNAFRGAIQEMYESGSSKLIVDLRSNAGGYLEMAVDISSWFLPMGEIIAREQFGNGDERLYRSKGYDIFNELPMIILINEGSASASEIMAGALREHGKAKLVGQKSFGKGSVQELISVNGNGSLKLTIAQWLTPNGVHITDNGLEPDEVVELTKEDLEADRDPQMDKAIELLKTYK